ncbi:MAG TPA: alpha/beta fold hydrolase [Acidimicrobiia bacterium]|nr:alpha/beta fold hydrolase [Acidimicrobiia bacterium]
MESIRIGELAVAYRRAGSGPPLVILPGAMDDGRWWERQLRDLSVAFTVVVWDAPGCGASTDAPTDWSLADYADCVVALVHAIGLAPVHLLGLSFGGALAIEVFHRHPDAVRSLLLISAYAGWVGSLGPDEARRRVAVAERMPEMSTDDLVDASLPTMVSPSIGDDERQWAERLLRDARTESAPTVARALAVDLRDVLPTIDVPTLVVHGTHDVRAPRSVADELVARIPRAEMAVVDGAGHLVNVDAPERLANEVRAFLARHA